MVTKFRKIGFCFKNLQALSKGGGGQYFHKINDIHKGVGMQVCMQVVEWLNGSMDENKKCFMDC